MNAQGNPDGSPAHTPSLRKSYSVGFIDSLTPTFFRFPCKNISTHARTSEKTAMRDWSAGQCSCKQTSTTYRSVNPRFENRGFFMLYEGKTISRDKYTTICCGETQWYFHNIWWSRINIRVCSRFQCRKRGRDQCKDFCWLQMRISLCEVTKSMN